MGFSPRVLVFWPKSELRWRRRLWMPGLFDGEHSFVLHDLGPEKCQLQHSETFSGLLDSRLLDEKALKVCFTAMIRALRHQAEKAT